MANDELRKKVKTLPNSSGVYMMKDDGGRVLYVGKANRLRARVGSYFRKSAELDPRCQALVRNITDFEYVKTPSEVDALFLEARLVRELQPHYNVSLKDGKTYPMLAISRSEDFPRVFVTRERGLPGHSYFGPFLHAADLNAAVHMLQKVFRFRVCTQPLSEEDVKKRRRRPCLRHSLRLCFGPCAGRISKRTYAENIRALRLFLRRGHGEMLERFEKRMADAAGRRDFELAALLRDQVRAVKRLSERGVPADAMPVEAMTGNPADAVADLEKMLGALSDAGEDKHAACESAETAGALGRIDGVDLSSIQGTDGAGAVVTFRDGLPMKEGYRRFKVSGVDDLAMLREVVRRRFARIAAESAEPAGLLLIDGGRGHMVAAVEELLQLPVRPRLVAALAKYEGDHLCVLTEDLRRLRPDMQWREAVRVERFVSRPAFRLLCHVRDEAHRFANAYHRVRRRKRAQL
ncbi:MAG: GIY-YIG nuclease family protein [Planctomycetota bacterium]|nr:GIY-YIG nuclease family protein [Planctomycetota bacterium]